ncbi:MAG: hypothetical protein EOL89_02890 [Actinobacteria bacterium]|nr:hypothetical protein [Actinomycetota bacterium]
MFAWLLPDAVEPVTHVDARDQLLRYAHCDGSVGPTLRLPRDLDPADPHRALGRTLPAGTVACLATAWALHQGRPLPDGGPDVVASPGLETAAGVRAHALDVPDSDIVTVRGLRLTTRMRTALDLARLAPIEVAAQALIDLRCPRERFDAYVAARVGRDRTDRALALSAVLLRPTASGSP